MCKPNLGILAQQHSFQTFLARPLTTIPSPTLRFCFSSLVLPCFYHSYLRSLTPLSFGSPPKTPVHSMANKQSLYEYEPSVAAAGVFVALFAIMTLIHLYRTFTTRTWFCIPFAVGAVCEYTQDNPFDFCSYCHSLLSRFGSNNIC
jgi:hypothetical protein